MNGRSRTATLVASTLLLAGASVCVPVTAQEVPVSIPDANDHADEFVRADPGVLLIQLDDALTALDFAFENVEFERVSDSDETSIEAFKDRWLSDARQKTLGDIQDAELTAPQLTEIIGGLVPEGLVAEEAVVTIGVSSVKKTSGGLILFKIINFGRNRESSATHSIRITYRRPPA